MPAYQRIVRSSSAERGLADADETRAFETARGELGPVDYLVIDTPGSDSFLARLGHSYADTLVTPLNDSFLDLDLSRGTGVGRIQDDFWLSPMAYQREFFLIGLLMLLHPLGLYGVHANGLSRHGRGCLVVGHSGRGKTTLLTEENGHE